MSITRTPRPLIERRIAAFMKRQDDGADIVPDASSSRRTSSTCVAGAEASLRTEQGRRTARSCRRCQGAEWVHATHARQRYCYRSSAGRHHPSSGTGGITACTNSTAPRAGAPTLPPSSASPWSHSMPGGVLRLAAALALSRASALTCQPCRGRLAAVSPPIPVAPTTRAARLLRAQASPLLLIVTPTSHALCDAAGGAVTRADIIECVG